MENLNILSLIISTLIPMIVGFIYYHKALFGNAWLASIGKTEEELKEGNMLVMMGVSLLLSFFLSLFLFINVNGLGQDTPAFNTFKHGAFHGILLAILVGLPVLITNSLFEGRNWKNIGINALYWMITLALMGGVMDAMNTVPESFFTH